MDLSRIRTALVGAAVSVCIAGPAPAQTTSRASVDSSEAEGAGESRSPALSDNGRFVAFVSDAANLVAGDTNASADVFVRDRQAGTTERVDVDSTNAQANGEAFDLSLSADGGLVAFSSLATNLVAADSNGVEDVFVRDRVAGTTEIVSVDSAGTVQGDHPSFAPRISADGSFVAFLSASTTLVAGGTNGFIHVFVHDRTTGITEIVSIDSSGVQGDGSCFSCAISADGRFVAFSSAADNLVAGDGNFRFDVFVRDRLNGTTVCASVDSSGTQGNNRSAAPSISSDGRFVAFESTSSNLIANDTNSAQDVFVHDLQSGTTEVVSVTSSGTLANDESDVPSISGDGRFVAFSSWASNLAGVSTNGTDVFVHDRVSGLTTWSSANPKGKRGDGDSGDPDNDQAPAISSDGEHVAFWSSSTDLVSGDTNAAGDVFVHGSPLTLDATPGTVTAGTMLTFTTWTGETDGAVMLVATAVDGIPTFVPILFSTFDANGLFTLSAVVPAGLAGHTISFQSFGFLPDGKRGSSETRRVVFQ